MNAFLLLYRNQPEDSFTHGSLFRYSRNPLEEVVCCDFECVFESVKNMKIYDILIIKSAVLYYNNSIFQSRK
jgi:hypothetical protein